MHDLIPAFSTENRSLGGFEITLDDIMANAVERKRESLVVSPDYSSWLKLENFSLPDIVNSLYFGSLKHTEYFERSATGCIYGDGKRYGAAPFAFMHPLAAKIIFGILASLAIIGWLLFTFFTDDLSQQAGLALGIICSGIFTFAGWGTMLNYNADLVLAKEIKKFIAEKKASLANEMEEFSLRLQSDPVFFLEELVNEMRAQKYGHESELEKIKSEFITLVKQPRTEVEEKIIEIDGQLDNLGKLKRDLSSEEIDQLRLGLEEKKLELADSITRISPLETTALEEIEKFDLISEQMSKTITSLVSRKQRVKSKVDFLSGIKSNLKTNVIDWDFAGQSLYNRQISKIINQLQDLNGSLAQVNLAVNTAIKGLPAGMSQKALAA